VGYRTEEFGHGTYKGRTPGAAWSGPISHTILLIVDDSDCASKINAALRASSENSFLVEQVHSCAEGVTRLTSPRASDSATPADIAAVLVELTLPDMAGIATFDALFAAAPHIPILVLCGAAEEPSAQLAVQRGAQDYILKARLDVYFLPKTLRNMIERTGYADALFSEKERAQVTLNSIGDAVISTNEVGAVAYLNAVAETLTGWPLLEASGRPLAEIFNIIDATTRQPAQDPMARALQANKTVLLSPNCVLIRRDGVETAIEDSAAPIHDRLGRVTGAVMVFRDVSASRALSLEMAFLAEHDGLTGLPNRLLFSDRLTQALARAKRRRTRLAVLYVDLDLFKNINDSLGHAVGDEFLKSAARALLGAVRGSDTVSRQGGDEFVILLSEVASPSDPAVAAEKVLAAIAGPHRVIGHELHVTASIGIAMYPDDGADAETLLKHADIAMYHAKSLGRSRSQFFLQAMNDRAVERQTIQSGLYLALERNELLLHYQPTVDLVTGAICGVEALVRWRHPERGLVLPGVFIPVAEECGLIERLGRWVLHEACRQGRAWADAGLPSLQISVNISAAELRQANFVDGVRDVLERTGLNPRSLELELTETFLLQDSVSTEVVLRELKLLGVRLALDDFGTGFSSFSYLKRFPLDALKIDRSFVGGIETVPDDAHIVSAVISMGNDLGLRVVAEGVESAAQLAFLKARRCPQAQGFYFSRPVAAGEIPHLVVGNPPTSNALFDTVRSAAARRRL
jgi:diguanylate cyclase (GGDEF)-like protein/PAS domain S-box-containing protein